MPKFAPSPHGTPGGKGWGEGGRNAARYLEISRVQAPSPPTPLPRSTGGEGSRKATFFGNLFWRESQLPVVSHSRRAIGGTLIVNGAYARVRHRKMQAHPSD